MMIWPFSTADTHLERAASTLSPFVTAALSGLDAQEIDGPARTRTLAECYMYGAVRYLASYDDMRSDNTGLLLERMLVTHFKADSKEIDSCFEVVCHGRSGR